MAVRREAHRLASEIPSLINLNIATASTLLEGRKTTAVALVQAHLTRIAEVNGYFNAVLETNPDAIAIAKALDDEQALSGRRSPIHGIPILTKDNLVTLDSMEAAAGSTILLGAKLGVESGVARKLRAASAIILGKSNLSKFSGLRTPKGISGWSPRGGLTMGAYCENMKTSGSSSGSSVATALGLAVVSFGTETDGSITSPAGREAVIGFKPTVGLVPMEGAIPVSVTQDSAGPIAKAVKDAAYVLNAIVEPSDSFPAVDYLLSYNANFEGTDEFDKMSGDDKLYAMAGSVKRDISFYASTLVQNPRNISRLHNIMELCKKDVAEYYPTRDTRDWELAMSVGLRWQEVQRIT
ncbi:uncharacterized protein RCO7_11636 [Rhynchosporium graminicola]|uniref:Amidase domain-containing protein n=1 Tax=Rhynchosporium graminicola TaxID=2792576 RepID=A0A1E1LJL3_9HELO|nr:uncharacterized protein RCO7_11636 [Rhynchosporium commune]